MLDTYAYMLIAGIRNNTPVTGTSLSARNQRTQARVDPGIRTQSVEGIQLQVEIGPGPQPTLSPLTAGHVEHS
jgi:hypothetical protein